MLKLLFLLVLTIASSQAKFFLNLTREKSVNGDEKSVDQRYLNGGAIVTQAERDAMKFVAYIFEKPSLAALSVGIVVNKAWIISPSAPVESKAPSKLGVTVCGGVALTDPGGITRKVKENVKNSDCAANPLIDCVSLLRICPSIAADHAATLVPSLTPYRDTTVTVNIVMYQVDNSASTKLFKTTKNIGEVCECEDITNFILDHHACITYDSDKYAYFYNFDDIPGFIVMDSNTNDVIGFLVRGFENDENGEIVLHLETVRTFIDNTAIIPPF